MAKSSTLSPQDLADILNASALLGAGGGGPRSVGLQIIDKLIKGETLPVLIAPADLGGTDRGAVSAFAGAPDASTGDFDYSPAVSAFRALASQTGTQLAWVLPGEVGAGNTFIPMAVAAAESIPVVDCAGARRAIPGLGQDTYAANSVPISPMIAATPDKLVGLSVGDAITADAVLRGVIDALASNTGIAMWTMDGDTVRTAAVEGTTSYALELGRTIRAAADGQKVAAACQFMGARVLGRGTITAHTEETTGGFDLGRLTVQCDDGSTLSIFNQNENLIAWSSKQGAPLIMAPDLICFMLDDGTGFSNADPQAAPGRVINVLGQPSIPQMRVPYIVTQFLAQLEAIGYGGPYIPFEC